MIAVKTLPLLAAPLLWCGAALAGDPPHVVASIKPIHSLVAAIMNGVGTPDLIVEGAASPHTYALKPSNARALEAAQVVFWVGPGMEAFLAKPLSALGGNASIAELDKAPGIEKLKLREGGAFEADDDGDDQLPDGSTAPFDSHLWLDPMNAKAMAAEITTTMVAADPGNALTYQANQTILNDKLDALDKHIAAAVKPVKSKPFVVFHDAYQYFEKRYAVHVAGSITVSPESIPGAARISEIHNKVATLGATCVFAEPQFEPRLVGVVIEGTDAKAGILDPEAATLTPGPDLYFTLMNGVAASLKDCLGQDS